MVGRFVEQQQVGLFPGDQCQRQTGFLATGKIQHRLIQARTTEVETAKEIAQRLFTLGRCQALQVQQRRRLGVQ